MMNQEDIKAFQALYKKYIGEDISEKDALEKGNAVLRLICASIKAGAQLAIDEQKHSNRNEN